MEAILGRDDMLAALPRVVTNKGAPGLDGIPVERLADYLDAQWRPIGEGLLAGRYRPAAVRGVEIPEPGGGTRGLGIPTALARLTQQAMHPVPTRLFDPDFSEASCGFRPGRSAHDAVLAARAPVAGGRRFVHERRLPETLLRPSRPALLHRPAPLPRPRCLDHAA